MTAAMDSRVRKLTRLPRWLIYLTCMVLVLVLLALAQLEYYHFTHPTANAIQNNQIAACEANNQRLAEDTQTWADYFTLQAVEAKANSPFTSQLINAIAKNDPSEVANIQQILVAAAAVTQQKQDQFMASVEKRDAPRDCKKAYQLTASASGGE